MICVCCGQLNTGMNAGCSFLGNSIGRCQNSCGDTLSRRHGVVPPNAGRDAGNRPTRARAALIAFTAAGIFFAQACTQKAPGNQQSRLPVTSSGQPVLPVSPSILAIADLPRADKDVPDTQYTRLENAYQLGTLYYALSGMPADYEALALAASQEYRQTADQFRKRELLQALKPQIDRQIATYKNPSARYFVTNISNGLQLGHYDFNSASFPFRQDLSLEISHFFNGGGNYRFVFTNGATFQHFPVRDEQRAKDIEALITRGQLNGEATGFLFAQGANTTNNTVQMQIVRVVLYGPDHNELGRY